MENGTFETPGLESVEIESADEILTGEVRPKGKPPLADRKQLSRLDPLRRYLLEISRYEPLTTEEEQRLTRLFRDTGDPRIGVRLVTANLRLVVRIVMLYHRVYSNVMDLIQEGNIGLIQAVKHYDPNKGARLPTYASYWIKAFIIKFILDNYRIVKVGTTNDRRKLLFNLRREKERLRLEGFDPTPQLLAKRLDVKEEDVVEVETALNSSDISLEDPISEESEMRVIDRLAGTEALVDEQIARGELKRILNDKLTAFARTLGERDRVILFERLVAEQPKTLQEIADQYGVTREAIRIAEKKVLERLRVYMKDELAEFREVDFAIG
ncbi:MAG: sigma-70 family RNA polymerase sigma factor [Acidobacteria bacterium]|nr:sigma-70 family RNA polymerase sigma factor [Acidobacteriota bacterium]